MNGKIIMSSCLGALLTVLWAGVSHGQAAAPPNNGIAAMEATAPANVDATRWQRVIARLKGNGLSSDSLRECLAPVQEAARQGLPPDPVLTRVEQGAAKGVEGKALQEAAQQRLATLQSAAAVLRQAGYSSGNAQHEQLMKSVALAMESGLSAGTLQGVLTQAKGGQPERMRSIVEAGETMRLSGLDEITVGQMMTDFMQRNMRRTEVIRASRFAVQQHKARVEGSRIRRQLWDGTGAGARMRPNESTPGASGPGPGVGGPIDRGSGPAGSSAQSGQGSFSTAPGNTPADAGRTGASGGSGSPAGNAPAAGAPQGSTPNRGQ